MKSEYQFRIITQVRQAAQENLTIALDLIEVLEVDLNKNIHKLRVITKQLRAYWCIVNPLLENQSLCTMHAARISAAAKLLTQSRESYVNRKLISSFKESFNGNKESEVFDQLLDLMPQSDETEIVDKTELSNIFQTEQDFWRRFECHTLRRDISENAGLTKTYNKAKKIGKKAINQDFVADIVHQWRKWLKYLMYELQVISVKIDKKCVSRYLGELEEVTDRLGKMHDLHVLKSLITDGLTGDTLKTDIAKVLKEINNRNQKLMKNLPKYYKSLFKNDHSIINC